jgi:NAD(P)-dependent dehydrogenase (short-subunit alcohol dehydrogenase family)
VRAAAAEVLAWEDVKRIDVLINSAGVMATPYEKTVDGFELQFGVNHIGGWEFTRLLIGKIIGTGEKGRVVWVAATGHIFSGIRWDDLDFKVGKSTVVRIA